MKIEHTEVCQEEHRVTISLTALEARLLLDDQPTVRREMRRGIRARLSGCDHAPKGEPKP